MTEALHVAARAAMGFTDAAHHALSRAFDLVLPPVCPSCREPVEGAGGLCARCWSKLSFIARPYCERLGTPFAHDMGQGTLSVRAIADPPAYGRARAVVRYDNIARALVHALKYGDRLELAPTMGRWMAQAGSELLVDADALVPVPLHWRRLWTRRFNQAALRPYHSLADFRFCILRCGAYGRRRSKSGWRAPSVRPTCRRRSACRTKPRR